ncbi:hypothetical protein ABK040_008706 [Willaertia magna]
MKQLGSVNFAGTKTALITGGNTGIGLATAKLLYSKGVNIYLACRSKEKMLLAKDEILKAYPNQSSCFIKELPIDLCNLNSVKEAALQYLNENTELHFLINNAGIFNGRLLNKDGKTVDGYSVSYQSCHLGHYLLTRLLLPALENAGKPNDSSRIINVSSAMHTQLDVILKQTKKDTTKTIVASLDDIDWNNRMTEEAKEELLPNCLQYMFVKVLNVMFSKSLAEKLKDKNIKAYSCHPGAISTNIYEGFGGWLGGALKGVLLPAEYGAYTNVYLCLNDNVLNSSGGYFDDCKEVPCHNLANNAEECELLWNKSEEQVHSFL